MYDEYWRRVEKVTRISYRYSLFWRQGMIFLIIVRTIFGHCWQHFYDYWICGFNWTGRHWQTVAIGGKTMWINQIIGDKLIYAASFVACLSRTMTQINNFLFFPHVYENWKETQTKSYNQPCECASMITRRRRKTTRKNQWQKKKNCWLCDCWNSPKTILCTRSHLHTCATDSNTVKYADRAYQIEIEKECDRERYIYTVYK